MKKIASILAIAALFGAPAWAAEESAAHGAGTGKSVQELVSVCASCHGEQGDQPIMPSYPVLAGQYASYLEHSLKAYRDGGRNNAVMSAQAANLSDHDIKLISRFFAAQPSPLFTPTER